VRVAVVGKGGSGKSVIAGTMARLLARQGRRVLALDSDLMPGLAISLGAETTPEPPLLAAAERGEDGRWRMRKGIGPVRAVQRFATPAPDGVRLLWCGKVQEGGVPAVMPAVQAFYRVIHRLPATPAFRDWDVVGDLPAGPRQVAFDWAPYAETFILLVEPTVQSLLTARRIARVASQRPGPTVTLVANKVRSADDVTRIEEFFGTRTQAVVPLDPAVAEAERHGVALLDLAPDASAVRAVAELVAVLGGGTVAS
jgi:CO dehydrogenase maturation factor